MMHLVLLMLFAFTNYQGSMSKNCKGGWTYYQKDESCLRQHNNYGNWINSRIKCKEDGGDIFEFHTKHKEDAVAKLRYSNNFKYWTGISDLDQDGTFEYINGTELVEDGASLGKFWKPTNSSLAKKECVVLNTQRYGLYHENCLTKRYPFCEIRLQPGDTTVVGSPACKRSTWTKIGHKFLYFHRKLADFATASNHCTAYGGQLLRPSSAEESQSIKEMDSLWKPGAWFFWIGVKQIKDNVWAWDSGEPLVGDNYSLWNTYYSKSAKAELCGAIVWADSVVWNKVVCKSLNLFTCEASSPCGITIFMAINGYKQFKNNTVVDRQYNQSVLIECFQEGTGPDTQISIKCTSVPEKMEGNRRVNMSLPKKYVKSEPSCACTFVYEDGTSEVFGIKFKELKYDDDKGGFSWLFLLLAMLLVLLFVGGLIVMGVKKQNKDKGGDNNKAVETKGNEDARSNVTESAVMEPKDGDTLRANEAGSVEVTESEV